MIYGGYIMNKKIKRVVLSILLLLILSQSALYANQSSIKEILGDEPVTYQLLKSKQGSLMRYCKTNFKDYQDYKWYGQSVAMMVGTEKVGGYPDGTIRPDQNITQAEVLKVLLSGDEFNQEIQEGEKWYAAIVRYAQEQGIVSQRAIEDYGRQATRMDVANYIYNYLQLSPSTNESVFKDVNIIDKKVAQTLYDEMLIAGYEENGARYFKPSNTITRAEAFSMLVNVIGYKEDQEAYKEQKQEDIQPEEEIVEPEEIIEAEEPIEPGKGPTSLGELTQKQYDELADYKYSGGQRASGSVVGRYSPQTIATFIPTVKGFVEKAFTIDYREDFETYYDRIQPYIVGDYLDELSFRAFHAYAIEHKAIMKCRFITHEDFIFESANVPAVRGFVQYYITSVEGDYGNVWVENYEIGKWYEVGYWFELVTGKKGRPGIDFHVHGFKSLDEGKLVK